MTALIDVFLAACTFMAFGGLIWNVANAIECWRLRRRSAR